jgi:tetratricopeptide (TPR) repeat protein
MNDRSAQAAHLPPAPLEFAHPLAVTRPDLTDSVLLSELPREYALPVLRTYRLVLMFAMSDSVTTPDLAALAQWEVHVLDKYDCWDVAVWSPLTVIASALRSPGTVDRDWLALACMTLVEWALKHGARDSAASLAEAAALIAPANPRYAYVVGRMHRDRGRLREAEMWLQRSKRVAVWNDDREAHSIALNSLGNLEQLKGRYREAEEFLIAALRAAKRARLRERQAAVYHDLLVVAVYTEKLAKGFEYARAAFNAYPLNHPALPKLAHDVAYLWFRHGQHGRALLVFQALLPHFEEPDARLRVLGYAARACGALGDVETFQRYWTEAFSIIDSGAAELLCADAALELGMGAWSLALWAEAERALRIALDSAADAGDNEVVVKASDALEGLRRGNSLDVVRRAPYPGGRRPEDLFAGQLVHALEQHQWGEEAGSPVANSVP